MQAALCVQSYVLGAAGACGLCAPTSSGLGSGAVEPATWSFAVPATARSLARSCWRAAMCLCRGRNTVGTQLAAVCYVARGKAHGGRGRTSSSASEVPSVPSTSGTQCPAANRVEGTLSRSMSRVRVAERVRARRGGGGWGPQLSLQWPNIQIGFLSHSPSPAHVGQCSCRAQSD
jgi:hypothetical protein